MLFWTTTSLKSIPLGSFCDLLLPLSLESAFATLFSLEIQSSFPRPVGNGFYHSVVEKTAAVENDLLDALFPGFGGYYLAYLVPLRNAVFKIVAL